MDLVVRMLMPASLPEVANINGGADGPEASLLMLPIRSKWQFLPERIAAAGRIFGQCPLSDPLLGGEKVSN
jgi:hypothetical protein